jgi:outer membrane protein OmpA-like peptidoglycan-associated protein
VKTVEKILVAALVAVGLAGCSSAPKPVVPNGWDKEPINTTEKIDSYNARIAEEKAKERESTVLSRQVDALNKQVGELKAFLLMQQMEAEAKKPKVRPLPTLNAPPIAIGSDGTESIDVRENSMLFRVSHRFNYSEFNPSYGLEGQLLQAARKGGQIEIRGRTDSNKDDGANRKIAYERAAKAKRFLIANGIPAKRIHVTYLSSGGFIADNNTNEGKAKNRRVEIEVMNIQE